MMLLTMVYLLKCRVYCLFGFGMDYLGKVHPILSTCKLVGLGHPSCLLVTSVFIVAPALLGVVRSVQASMLLAERTVFLCLALLGLLGVA